MPHKHHRRSPKVHRPFAALKPMGPYRRPWNPGPPITDPDEKLQALLGFPTVDKAMEWLGSDKPPAPEDMAELLQMQQNQEDTNALAEYELTGNDPDAESQDAREARIAEAQSLPVPPTLQ